MAFLWCLFCGLGMDYCLRSELHRAAQVTTVYVTHDQEEAMTLADRIVVMSDGRILQDAPPLAVYDEPFAFGELPFVNVCRLFTNIPLPVPTIAGHADDLGILMLEDLGDVRRRHPAPDLPLDSPAFRVGRFAEIA
mgnify:CR=1 FL=1